MSRRVTAAGAYASKMELARVGVAAHLQAVWRAKRVRDVLRERHVLQWSAARLQGLVRGFLCRRRARWVRWHAAATSMSSLVRGFLVRRRTRLLVRRRTHGNDAAYCATRIAAAWRGSVQRRAYAHTRMLSYAACSIQRVWKGFLARRRFGVLIDQADASRHDRLLVGHTTLSRLAGSWGAARAAFEGVAGSVEAAEFRWKRARRGRREAESALAAADAEATRLAGVSGVKWGFDF